MDPAFPGAGDPVRALIFGGAGQDGFYLIQHLVELGHDVVATRTRPARELPPETRNQVRWLWSDLRDDDMVSSAVFDARPDVVFNLAAVTTPGVSWLEPESTAVEVAEVNAMGTLRVLRAVNRYAVDARVVHASSAAIYDPDRYGLYGVSKLFAHQVVQGYRLRGLWAANATLYSHTSPRQDPRFLVPHICREVARIRGGMGGAVRLAMPGALRDWMHAEDAVRALVKIAGQSTPDDFDVATGTQWSALQVVEMALAGSGRAVADLVDLVDVDREVPTERPARLDSILATGWRPARALPEVVDEMVRAEAKELGL